MNNYYPNYYQNMYNSGISSNPYAQLIQQQVSANTLNGKVVDSQDVVKATEVPIGSYGVFPKADLSEIYIKSWNNNGTTNIVTFKPDMTSAEQTPISQTPLDAISEKLTALEEKIDKIVLKENVVEEKEKEKEFKF